MHHFGHCNSGRRVIESLPGPCSAAASRSGFAIFGKMFINKQIGVQDSFRFTVSYSCIVFIKSSELHLSVGGLVAAVDQVEHTMHSMVERRS